MSGTAERRELWGGETAKAVVNFPVSGEPIPPAVAHWLGRIKAAAARANADLGLLDPDVAQRIAEAGDRIAAGELNSGKLAGAAKDGAEAAAWTAVARVLLNLDETLTKE